MKNRSDLQYYIYLRKSSEGEDRQVQSIQRQAAEVNSLISSLNLNVVGTFQESRSAMVPFNRPEFSKMIKGIKSGKATGIVCWHINRLARNPLESGIIQQLLEDGKLRSIMTKEREYTAADNSIIISVESSLATQYSKDLGKMVRSGMEKKVSQGIAPIKAPIGYMNTKNPEHGSNYIVKDPNRFALIRKAWELMLLGIYSPSRVLEKLNKEISIKRKGVIAPIAKSTLYKVFTNPFYAGLFKFKGSLYSGTHPAMITVDEYDKVQTLLGNKGRPRHQKHYFPYTGMIKCGECGSAITATEKKKLIKATGLIQTYHYYYCTRRKKSEKECTARKVIPAQELDGIVYEEINKISISEKFRDIALIFIRESLKEAIDHEQEINAQRKSELGRLQKELKNLLQMRLSGSISDDEFVDARKEREAKLIRITTKLQQGINQGSWVIEKVEKIFMQIARLNKRFSDGDPEYKKGAFYSLGKNHTLKGKILLIEKHSWLKIIEKDRDTVEEEIRWLELDKYVDTKVFYMHFKDACPVLCGLIRNVETEIKKECYSKNS